MRIIATLLSVFSVGAVFAQTPLPPALERMADTERAFAKRAQEIPVRDAFVEFFADEAVAFEPDPVPARDSLRKQTRPQPAGFQLLWEPRRGDIAASGDLGYLTGPSRTIVPGQPPRHGNYFSVWKRQADGTYRVILDVGGSTPDETSYPAGFTRAPASGGWNGASTREANDASLLAADQALSAALAEKGIAAAYAAVMAPTVHFQRPGSLPATTPQASIAWLQTHTKAWTTAPVKAETAAAGDLGYTWGKYQVTPPDRAEYRGYYVRVWTRTAGGTWRLVAEVTTPAPPAKPQ